MHHASNITLGTFQVFNQPMKCNLQRFFSRSGSRNPYDVLGLKKSCSTKDVKKAYIKRCKELHPDMKPGDPSQHKKFIELNNAYTTILNAENKKHDFDIRTHSSHMYSRPGETSSQYWESEKPWYETKEYQEQFHQHSKKDKIKLNNSKANLIILTGCFILIIIGSALYICAYRYATRYKIRRVDEKSKKISENYYDIRKKAIDNGKMEQLDKLKRRWSD